MLLLAMAAAGLAAAAPGARAALPFIRAGPTNHFVDEAGRVRIFHGSNRVMKAPPWYFSGMANSTREFELMEALGFNAMRLGFMWSGYAPAPDTYDQGYIDTIQHIVRGMGEHGVYALLDMHQDVLSSKFCLYDGMPLWVVNKSKPKHNFPWPLPGNCSTRGWEENILSQAAARAYQDLYENTGGMLDDLVGFWSHAAAQFKETSSVLGYELINEPFAGDFYEDPARLLPGVAGAENLQPLHAAAT